MKVSMRHTITLLFLLLPALAEAQTDWYVRHDGGDLYNASTNTTGRCNGKANAAAPSSGTNQACAVSELEYLWDNGVYRTNGYSSADWVIAGGDRVHIQDCSNNGSATDHSCRIGWRNGGNSYDGPTSRRWGIQGDPYGSGMPAPPNGTSASPTQILGANYGSCHADSAKAQLRGGFGVGTVVQYGGTSYVNLGCVDISDASGCGQGGQANGCNNNIGSLSDYASTGFYVYNTTHSRITDVSIHGLGKNGIQGWTGDDVIMDYLALRGNGQAGWNADPNDGTTGSGNLTVKHFDISWNGCAQEFPIVNALPYSDCTDDNSGGYGDGFGTATVSSSPAWHVTFDTGVTSYNTQDGLDALHVNGGDSSMTILNVQAFGNMGQQTKIGGSRFVQQNNLLTTNCNALRYAIPGTPPDAVQFTATLTSRPGFTANTTAGSNVVTATGDVSQVAVGDFIYSINQSLNLLPLRGGQVTAISGSSITLNINASNTGSDNFSAGSSRLTNVVVTSGSLAIGQRLSFALQQVSGIRVPSSIVSISGNVVTIDSGVYASGSGLQIHSAYNSSLGDFCRAADGGIKITVDDGYTAKFNFNTVVAANSTGIDVECNYTCSANTAIDFRNNILIGYRNDSDHGYIAGGSGGNLSDLLYVNSGYNTLSAPGTLFSNNIAYNTKSTYLCTTGAGTAYQCVDPLLTDESWHQYGAGDFTLTSSSPARGNAVAISGITTDYNAFTRLSPTSEGALEYGSVPTTPPTGVAPSITSQPSSQSVTAGSTAVFSSAASGTPTPTVQWYRNGSEISGATSASYTTGTLTTADSGATFYAIWTNSQGSAQTTTATLTVNASAPTLTSLTVAPASNTLGPSGTVNLIATAHYSDSSTPIVAAAWSSSNTAIATVTATGSGTGAYGAVAATGTGSATMTATFMGQSATASVTVVASIIVGTTTTNYVTLQGVTIK